ncbi:MAG: ABC transporter permease, partial [Brevibacterium sp.]|nr:ABC transporter permease [Brevibacterium sp.]
MSTTIAFARSSAWVHRSSLLSGSITLFLAALLLSATGTWIQSGISLAGESDARGDIGLLSVASSFAGTTVLVVIVIVASVLTQSLRPRAGQLTLLRTIGATPKQIRRLVITEVRFVFALSTPLGIVAGSLLAPRVRRTLAARGLVPPGFEPASSPTTAFGVLCVLGGTVILSSLLAVRSVTRQSAAEAK